MVIYYVFTYRDFVPTKPLSGIAYGTWQSCTLVDLDIPSSFNLSYKCCMNWNVIEPFYDVMSTVVYKLNHVKYKVSHH